MRLRPLLLGTGSAAAVGSRGGQAMRRLIRTVGALAAAVLLLVPAAGQAAGEPAIALTGSAAFTKAADACTATSLGPGKSCSVTVTYSPAAAGQSDTATLAASGNKAAATTSLTLTGTGSGPRHLYWGHSPFVPRIGRADIDGQNVNQSLVAS